MKLKGYLLGCLSSATYGMIPLFALPMMREGMHFPSILCYRFTGASLMIGLFLMLRGTSLRVRRGELAVLAMLGLLFALSAQFLFWSYEYMAAGVAATVLFLYPVMVALIMGLFFKEKVSWVTQLAIALAFSGILLLYRGDGSAPLNATGVALVLLSGYALYIVVVNRSCVREMAGPKLTFYAMAFSAAFFWLATQAGQGLQPLPNAQAAADCLMLALIPTVVSCIAMVYAVQYIGSTATAVLGAMEPLTAVCIGVLVFAEAFTPGLASGMLLIVGSVMLIVLSDRIRRIVRFGKPAKKHSGQSA